MAVATQSAILSELITTAKDYKKRYPNALGFVVAWIREMDVPAWEWITDWYGDPVGIKAKPRCVAWCNGGDKPHIIDKPETDLWRVWLMKYQPDISKPTDALAAHASLAKDVAEVVGLRRPDTIIDGKHYENGLGEWPEVMRWTVDVLGQKRMEWIGSPKCVRAANGDSRNWVAEMPCVFDAIARALESHHAKAVGFYCDPMARSIRIDGKLVAEGLDEITYAYVAVLAEAPSRGLTWKEICQKANGLAKLKPSRLKAKIQNNYPKLYKHMAEYGHSLERTD